MRRAIQRFRLLFVLAATVALALTLGHQRAAAQPWTAVFTAPKPITCITFLDDLGQPQKGFLGMSAAISYTTDGGANWTASTTPPIVGTVTNFTFKDPQTGWASASHSPVAGGRECRFVRVRAGAAPP